MKLFVGYSKASEQPQSSFRLICQSHTMKSTGRKPATIRIAAISPHHTLRHERRFPAIMGLNSLIHFVAVSIYAVCSITQEETNN